MNEALPERDADRFLRMARAEQQGKLTVYLGAAPGVGKTYRMLQEAARRKAEGEDVVIGVAETHGRGETQALLARSRSCPGVRSSIRGTGSRSSISTLRWPGGPA